MSLSKLRSISKTFMSITIIVIIAFIVRGVMSYVNFTVNPSAGIAGIVSSVLLSIICLLIMFNVTLMLRSVSEKTSPFTMENVRRLRWIGVLLLTFEPIQLLAQFLNPFQPSEGVLIRTYISLGGMVFVCGLAVLGLTMVFRYGIELQRQADETL